MTDEEKARFETNAVFLCREISKETGQIVVYELDMPVDGHTIFCLRIRQQFNPELVFCAKNCSTKTGGLQRKVEFGRGVSQDMQLKVVKVRN